ncbi:hypothetical protein EGJ27_14985 [Pseudomonas sp. v388]|uniref:hypothetical protein n=1 Tax=Pseudomonas sp. v388 TaxID=2479849 RepID=UPI000F79FA31|nr:hypothetical protein [Pseudomonas sp. v388]RRV05989.1 hypothetical protein EGJ27_14985 [Pseudomonas sp. v388]
MLDLALPFLIVLCIAVMALIALAVLIKTFYVKVPQGTALIVNDLSSRPKVYFTGAMVLPYLYLMEKMQISVITLEIERKGKGGLICRDNMRADITVAFFLRVNETQDDVLKVAKAIGVQRASDKAAVNELFNAKFSEALKTVGKQFDFVELFEDRVRFRDEIVNVIGQDLSGYVLEDVAIDYLEQTPKAELDRDNILDAEGIRKITELTSSHNVVTNELERDQDLRIQKKNVEAIEASLALERQKADAQARQKREIASVIAREEAETLKIQSEEHLRAEEARIATAQRIDIAQVNHQREVDVANQNSERVVMLEKETVVRAQSLAQIDREREVALSRIERDRQLEEKRSEIANVTRERVSVEKTVAQEEEAITTLRVVAEADRKKIVVLTEAQAQAERDLVCLVKQAEADSAVSEHRARELVTLAEADLSKAERESQAAMKRAEGIRAEKAAPGLAEAQVRIQTAEAAEREGLTEALVLKQRLLSQAEGDRAIGESKAEIRMQIAQATEREGLAEAAVLRQRLLSQAEGDKAVGESRAATIHEVGAAEAQVLQKRFEAEAAGLTEKFEAMQKLTGDAREHEEFRLALQNQFDITLASIAANEKIAEQQAQVLSCAMSKASIQFVGGGDNSVFDAFVKSLSVGKAIEGLNQSSPLAAQVIQAGLGMLSRVAGDKVVARQPESQAR